MTFRERIENDPLRFLLGALFIGFTAGIATYRGILEVAQLETVSKREAVDRREEEVASTPTAPSRGRHEGRRLPPLSLTVQPGVPIGRAEQAAARLHTQFGLRPLTALESGKTFAQIPVGTYAFVSASRMTFNWDGTEFDLPDAPVGRAGSRWYEFEVLKPTTGPVSVIGFAGASEAANVSVLDGTTERLLTLFSQATLDAPTLVLLPTERIFKASSRLIELDSGENVAVLDLVVK